MAVQLLETWLLKEQEKIQNKYRELNRNPLREPDILFIGDSIVEYYPLQELFLTDKYLVNRGIRGYKTDLLDHHLDAHIFGQVVDKVFLLIGTNDIGKEMPLSETIDHMTSILQQIARLLPLAQIKLLSVLPVNEGAIYKGTVYIRSNQKIQALNQAYRDLAEGMVNVEFIDVFDCLLGADGQLKPAYTTDGLHLTIEGYRVLSKALQNEL